MGRLLITFLLCKRSVLSRPLLYLSHYLKQNRSEYYDRLQAIRVRGAWEEWLAFFFRGVREVAANAQSTARSILELQARTEQTLKSEGKAAATLLRTLDLLFQNPVVTPAFLQQRLDVSYVTANKQIGRLEELAILEELTGYKRNRRFSFKPYLDLFDVSS